MLKTPRRSIRGSSPQARAAPRIFAVEFELVVMLCSFVKTRSGHLAINGFRFKSRGGLRIRAHLGVVNETKHLGVFTVTSRWNAPKSAGGGGGGGGGETFQPWIFRSTRRSSDKTSTQHHLPSSSVVVVRLSSFLRRSVHCGRTPAAGWGQPTAGGGGGSGSGSLARLGCFSVSLVFCPGRMRSVRCAPAVQENWRFLWHLNASRLTPPTR